MGDLHLFLLGCCGSLSKIDHILCVHLYRRILTAYHLHICFTHFLGLGE